MVRAALAITLITLAVLYWLWPNDLWPDWRPFGRADDIAVALVTSFFAIRLVAGLRLRPEPGVPRSARAAASAGSPAAAVAAASRRVDGGDRSHRHDDELRGARELAAIAEALAPYGPPIVVYNASHSGSRLLTRMLSRMGVYMGAHLNDSEDSLDMAELVEHVILEHAPDFSRLFASGDPLLADLALSAVAAHLSERPPGARWGWKLCETGHALPVIARLFPGATFLHLIRDGRDVAFSNFVAPKHPYWRKIHFNTAEIRSWHGLDMSQRAYREHGPLFNAVRWANSASLGRAHGSMLGERYHEIRYERLVGEPERIARNLAQRLHLPDIGDSTKVTFDVDGHHAGKWRAADPRDIREVCQLIGPTLQAFGYPADP